MIPRPIEQFYGNICLFCGEKAEQRFYSGSYETYFFCDCQEHKDYMIAYREFEKASEKAIARKNIFDKQAEAKNMKYRIESLEKEINEQQKILSKSERFLERK